MTERPFVDIAPWPPTRYTEPLSPDFPSAFDPYIPMFRAVWLNAFGYELDEWQVQLVRAVLEIFPEGHARAGQLRWLYVVISLARQNGKSEIAAAIGLLMLLVKNTALVIGIASSVDQARIVYERTMQAISGTAALARKFRVTGTRGIRSGAGARYEMKAAKSAALQGLPIDLGLVDELHLILRTLWTDLINGTGGRPNCIVVGITTAGDSNSELLLHLYEEGEGAIALGEDARMGFYLWEAPEARIPDDDDSLGRYLAHANPAIAMGRVDIGNAIAATRGQHPSEAIRYRLNRFVSSTNVFIPPETWTRRHTSDPWPVGFRPVFVFERTADWGYANISAFTKRADGKIYCDLVATLNTPNKTQLVAIAERLAKHNPSTFAMWNLNEVADDLKLRGFPVKAMTQGEVFNASAMFYAKVLSGEVIHTGHPLLSQQIPRTMRKNSPDGKRFRISPQKPSLEIDAVMSHVIGIYVAETQNEIPLQVF